VLLLLPLLLLLLQVRECSRRQLFCSASMCWT
jgi:hypothetical protein